MPFSDEEWERAAGVACPGCGQEVWQLFSISKTTRGCSACVVKGQIAGERRIERRQAGYRLSRGLVSLQDVREGRY